MKKLDIRQLAIKKRLIYGFLSIGFLFVITLVINIQAIDQVKQDFRSFYESPHSVTLSSMQIRSSINALERLTIEYTYGVASLSKVQPEMERQKELITSSFESVKERYLGDQDLVTQLIDHYNEVVQIREEIFRLVTNGEKNKAQLLLNGEYKNNIEQVHTHVNEIFEDSAERAEGFYTRSMNNVTYTYIFIGIFSLIIIIAGIKIARIIRISITVPIDELEKVAEALSQGKLDIEIEYNATDELGSLANSMRTTVKSLQLYIRDIQSQLGYIAAGDITHNVEIEYVGDFYPIKEAINKIILKLNETLGHINQSAQEVSSGADDLAQGATGLADGATEQASVIEEFIASTEEISENINQTVKQAYKTAEISQNAKAKGDEGTKVMEDMLQAMKGINNSSQNISDIIKIIDSIASQTNLLALNAAIESARAGDAGRGFAVVANEIRELANRSSETVKEIESMVKESLIHVEQGQEMATYTAKAITEIVSAVEETAEIAEKLLDNSTEQKASIGELVEGTKHLSTIVETNSSTSQESAAISEELAAQAENLTSLIEYFSLNEKI